MNPYLDEDLLALGEHARRFAAARVAPGFQERDRTRTLDRTLMREMGRLGFIAPELPQAHGGQAMGSLASAAITANLLCRRETLVALGGFDESLRLAQDLDLVYRILAQGGRLGFDQ